MSIFHYDPSEAQKAERIPEGHDYDDNDHVAAGAIVCGVILGACAMALVLYALAHL